MLLRRVPFPPLFAGAAAGTAAADTTTPGCLGMIIMIISSFHITSPSNEDLPCVRHTRDEDNAGSIIIAIEFIMHVHSRGGGSLEEKEGDQRRKEIAIGHIKR